MPPTPYKLYRSTNASKKYDVYVPNDQSQRLKKVSFGARGYQDYTQHKDKERRDRYRERHIHDHINDPFSPGCWSYHVLWGNSTSLDTNLRALVRRIR